MDRDEILEKSRLENQRSDERDQLIELKAYRFSQRAMYLVTFLLLVAASIQKIVTDHSFADTTVFLVICLVSVTAQHMVRYRYYRRKKDLTNVIWGWVGILAMIFFLILHAI